MDLVQLYDEQVIDCLMNDKLGEGVLFRAMCVTQADLLVIVTVVENCSAIEVTLKVLETHPEDTIQVIIHAQLLT